MFGLSWSLREQRQHTPHVPSWERMHAFRTAVAALIARGNIDSARKVGAIGDDITAEDVAQCGDDQRIAVALHQRIVLPLPARSHLLVCDGSVDVECRPTPLDWMPEQLQGPRPVALRKGEHFACAGSGCVVVHGTGQHAAHLRIIQEPGPCRAAMQWVQRVLTHHRGQYPSRNTSGSGPRPRA
ncbi:hypothetical protein [Robbsia andropogonis]|uniref:hypothetical protein n=2 Tax=Robbsia andropogonis TaxID=28092 RepID=UPI0012FBD31C|nr:hypothetical protein [Robbsia andropogonis]